MPKRYPVVEDIVPPPGGPSFLDELVPGPPDEWHSPSQPLPAPPQVQEDSSHLWVDPVSPEGQAWLLEAASPRSWQGWCRDVARAWSPLGPRLLDQSGRFARMTRRDFHQLPAARLRQLQWRDIDIVCPPWGAFYGEVPSGDFERDGEMRAESYLGWTE